MNKLRILCLHGNQQNKDIFQQKTGSFRKPLKKYADFEFLDAPHLLKDALNKNIQDLRHSENVLHDTFTDGRGWWLKNAADGDNDGLQESLKVFEKTLCDRGPFDGVMAFSQGAAFLALACILLGEISCFNTIKFVIFVAGFKSNMPAHQALYELKTRLNIPSLHVVGETDQVISSNRSKELLEIFSNAQLVTHSGGHYVPATRDLREIYVQFIVGFIDK